MTSNDGIQVSVYTRWHQLSVPLAFALAAGSFMLVVFNRGPIVLAVVLAVLGLLVPPLVAFKGFPTRNTVKVTSEGWSFRAALPSPSPICPAGAPTIISSWSAPACRRCWSVQWTGPHVNVCCASLSRPWRRGIRASPPVRRQRAAHISMVPTQDAWWAC